MKKIIIVLIPIFISLIPNTTSINEMNQNTTNTLTIPNLINKEPIVQGVDNEYYLNHDINGNKNIIGSTYLDYRNKTTDNIILIYSHNSKTLNTPFKKLENYYNEQYFNKNKIILLTLDNIEYQYEIFSIILIKNNFFYTNLNPNNYINHINKLKDLSIHKTSSKLTKNDRILILQTCTYIKNYNYLLVVAKQINQNNV